MKTPVIKYKLFFLLSASLHTIGFSQVKTGMENYQYMADRSAINPVAVIHHRTKNDVYTELRYNYEELHTASAYAGKTLFLTSDGNCSVTPMAGIVVGKYNGGSLAWNTDLGYNNFYFSSEAQYTISRSSHLNNFFYNWSELGYYALPWFYTGVTVQQTSLYKTKMQTNKGITAGVTKNKWSVPVYCFNPLSEEKYFVIGLNFEWEQARKNKMMMY